MTTQLLEGHCANHRRAIPFPCLNVISDEDKKRMTANGDEYYYDEVLTLCGRCFSDLSEIEKREQRRKMRNATRRRSGLPGFTTQKPSMKNLAGTPLSHQQTYCEVMAEIEASPNPWSAIDYT
jgi:hypothetical protein